MSDTQGGLAKKLAKILADVERVPKNGRNDFHNYDYVTEADLLDAIRPKLAKAGVFVFSGAVVTGSEHYETKDGKTKIITTVKTTHTFMDGDTGETHTVECVGQGEDAGDKGAYKAITGASKYFWMKNFMVSTGDDPERGKAPPRKAAPARNTTFDDAPVDQDDRDVEALGDEAGAAFGDVLDAPHAEMEMPMGKFKGKTLGYIWGAEEGPAYLKWAASGKGLDRSKYDTGLHIEQFLEAVDN